MFSFGKKTGIFSTKEEENDHSPKDTWGFSKLFAHNYFTSNFEHQASDGNISLKHDHTKKFICHPENKIIHCFESEKCRPIVPLPASLVTEIVSEKEGRIHALEEKISHLQNEFQKTKMKSCRELKRLWSLRNNCMKGRKQSSSMQRNITLRKALSSPNLTWGRRGQLISLLESIKSSVKSANNSRENIFSRWNHGKSVLQSSTRVITLTNDLEVQLWVWMERIDDLEKETCIIKYDRDNMEKALERCYQEIMEIEDQITSIGVKEGHENNILLKDLKRKSNLGKEKFDPSMKSKDEKIHRLILSLEDQKNWLKKLQVHYQDLKQTKQTLRDEMERNEFLCSLKASKIDLNERMEYLEKLMNEAKDYASKLVSLREDFGIQVNEWKIEATEVWKEILRFEGTQQLSLSEIERLKSEIQELKSKCSVLVEEKLNMSKTMSSYEEHNDKEKKNLKIQISSLRTKLKSTKLRLRGETKCRADLEEKLKVLDESKIKLENDLEKETEVCSTVLKELQIIKNTFEIERKKFESAREILEAQNNEEKELEASKVQKLLDDLEMEKEKVQKLFDDLELEKKRHSVCKSILEDEKKKHKHIIEIESSYNQALQEKEHLSKIIAKNEAKIQILEEKIVTLDQELESEKLKLKSVTNSFNEEIAKGEKIHKILRDLTAEKLKKERLMKNMTDDLKSRDCIESQLRSINQELEQNILKCGTLLTEVEGDQSKSNDLSKRCKDLVEALLKEKSQCVTLNEKLLTVSNNFMEKIHLLEEELDDKKMKIKVDAEVQKNLETKIEGLAKDLKDQRLSHKTELDSVKVINVKLHKDLHAALSEAENYKMKVEEMNKIHDDEIKNLRVEVADEQHKFKNANEKTEKLKLKLKEILSKTGNENERMLNALKEVAAVRENEELIQRMYQESQKEIECLQRNLEIEKFKRLQAEKHIDSFNSKIEELQNKYTEEKVIAKEKIKELTLKIENRELMNEDLKKEIFYLKARIEDHRIQEITAQEKFQTLIRKEREIVQTQINEKNLLGEEIRKLQAEVKCTEAIQIKNHEYENEMKFLKSNIKNEQSKRMKAEEEMEKLLKEIEEIHKIHMKEKMQIQLDLKHKISENEKILAEEQKKYKEMEERLIKEKDILAEDLKYIDIQDMVAGSYGDGVLCQRSYDDMVGSLRTDEKIKGIIDYHERLADKICFRSMSEAASIRRTAGIEILQLREELNSLKRQLLTERTTHKVTVMNLENDLKELYSPLTSIHKDRSDTSLSDQAVPKISQEELNRCGEVNCVKKY